MSLLKQMQQELLQLEEHSNLRHLPKMTHDGRELSLIHISEPTRH